MFTFLSVIRQNFKYNLRILANFRVNTQKSTEFAFAFSKNYNFFFFGFSNKGYTFYTKNLFFYNERSPNICKNQFFRHIFTFLSVMLHYFECNLRILENFHIKTQNLRILAIPFKKPSFWGIF